MTIYQSSFAQLTMNLFDASHIDMLHIPYLCTPYPDEIFGSWLARIRLHNYEGAWRCLIQFSGYGDYLMGSLFDTVNFCPRVERLLDLLEVTHEHVLTKMTTMPYWLTFEAAESDLPTRKPGMHPRQLHGIGSYGALIFKSHKDYFRPPRYCPRCLSEDLDQYGEQYWHTSHQLPNVFVCTKHRHALRTTCDTCGCSAAPSKPGLILLPRIKCLCGRDLSTNTNCGLIPAPYLKLAQISVEALNVISCSWSRTDVRSFLREAIYAEHGTRRIPRSIITDTFGKVFWVAAPPEHTINLPVVMGRLPMLRLHYQLSETRAPECCALLTALDIPFSTAVDEFTSSRPAVPPQVRHSHPTSTSLSIEVARASLLDKVTHGKRECTRCYVYWYLRLKDPKWMESEFPVKHRIPQKECDRQFVLRIATDADLSEPLRHAKISQSLAGIRASIRDYPWFSAQRERLSRDWKIRAERARQLQCQGFAARVGCAIDHILHQSCRPRRIGVNTLSSATGLARKTVMSALAATPTLRELLDRENSHTVERQLLWAVRELQNAGQNLTASNVLRRACLKRTRVTIALSTAISRSGSPCGSVHSSQPGRITPTCAAYRYQILSMHARGTSLSRIAENLGLSRKTVSFWLKRYLSGTYSHEMPNKPCNPSDVMRLRLDGKEAAAIAISLQVPVSKVAAILTALRLVTGDVRLGFYKGTKLNSIDVPHIIELRRSGLTYKAIAGHMGVSKTTVSTLFSVHSAVVEDNWIEDARRLPHQHSICEPGKIMSLRAQGLNFATIASITGNSRSRVWQYFYAHSSHSPRKRLPVDTGEILRLRAKKYSFETIGYALGFSEYKVWSHFRSLPNVDPRLKQSLKHRVSPDEVLNLRRKGLPVVEIIKRLKISKTTVYRIASQATNRQI